MKWGYQSVERCNVVQTVLDSAIWQECVRLYNPTGKCRTEGRMRKSWTLQYVRKMLDRANWYGIVQQ